MAIDELRKLNHALRRVVLSRWTDDKIMDHVAIKLPAPIFDRLSLDLRAEIPAVTADPSHFRGRDHFEFEGVRYERLPGAYWQVSA